MMATFDYNKSHYANRMKRVGGFTYIGLLILIAIMGILLAVTGEVWHMVQKREKEQELLFVGNQFRRAIDQFYQQSPPQSRQYATSLEELMKDPRYPGTRRYLRKIYPDPITGETKWGLVKGLSGEIYGVHSLSQEGPLQRHNFSLANVTFDGKKTYAEWAFMHSSMQAPPITPNRP